MANVNAEQRAIVEAGGRAVPSASGGEPRIFADVYTANALPNGDTITFGNIPTGSRLIDVILDHEALGTSTTLALAIGSDTVITAAGSSGAARKTGLGAFKGSTVSGDVVATLGGANTAGSDRKVQVIVVIGTY